MASLTAVFVFASSCACGESQRQAASEPPPPTPAPAGEVVDPAPPDEEPTYVTGLEIWAPDETASWGIAVVARYSPPQAAELRPPAPHPDAEHATGLLIGHRIATDASGRGIGLASGTAAPGSYSLPRDGLPAPVDVVVARDGVVVALLELTPCDHGCIPASVEGEISLVLPAGTVRRLGIVTGGRMFAAP